MLRLEHRALTLLCRAFRLSRRDLRLASGIVMLAYLATHLSNHAVGLVSLRAAEFGLVLSAQFWSSRGGTILLYSAFTIHFVLAFWAIYERRTFRLPPLELLRIGLGLWLPVLLMGHFAATRLQFELLGASPTYGRIVSELWASNSEWRQIGLLAPGWLHGCLGLQFVFRHRPWWRHLQLPLFTFALLLPVLSALGFVTMGRDLDRLPAAAKAELYDPLGPEGIARQQTMQHWLDRLLWGYAALVVGTFGARGVRILVEKRRRGLLSITYPNRKIQVPRGWSVLEASRAFHIAHASSCGGRARCSTCRVRILKGMDSCPEPGPEERATLDRISAEADVRLACQLRPTGDLAVSPLVLSERPIYRMQPPALESEREVVLLFCDFTNSKVLARDHMAHDVLFAFKRYAESACRAIRSAGGTICYVEHESIFAIFGLSSDLARACRSALSASVEIDQSLRELNERLGQEWGCRAEIAVSIHAGHVALSKIGQAAEMIIAAGDAVEVAAQMRRTANAAGKSFAVSDAVFAAAQVEPPAQKATEIATQQAGVPVYYIEGVQLPSQEAALRSRIQRAATAVLHQIRG